MNVKVRLHIERFGAHQSENSKIVYSGGVSSRAELNATDVASNGAICEVLDSGHVRSSN